MKTLLASLLALGCLGLPSFAYAQDGSVDSSSPDAPVPAPLPEAAPSPPSPRHRDGTCVLGAHAGIEDADAQTAAALVCGEIAHHGAAAGVTYRVGLGRLGRTVILSVTAEPEPGVIRDERHLTLSGIEEVPVAAPRVAEAIVNGTPIAETAKVDSVVGEEARPMKKRAGSVHFATGIIGVLPPFSATNVDPAPGLDLELHYETARFAAFIDARFAGTTAEHETTSVGYQALSVGGRYYLSDADISAYLGGGLAFSHASLKDTSFNGANGGFAAFGEFGVEALRTHHAHLALGVRLDAPFYSLQNNQYSTYQYDNQTGSHTQVAPSGKSSSYYAPITMGLILTF